LGVEFMISSLLTMSDEKNVHLGINPNI
jgi:hypothetical protein